MQEKLCTEPCEPDQALELAIAFEEGVKRQKFYGLQTTENPRIAVQTEPEYAIEKSSNLKECFRCGDSNFTPDHIKKCTATNNRCKFCKIVWHVEKCCNKKFTQRQKEMLQRLKSRSINFQGMRRVNYFDEESEEEESERNEEQLVLQTDGNGSKPFYIEGTMCGNYFEALIDTGSPVSIFTKRDLTKTIGERKVVIRDMIDKERYVDYNKRPLDLLCYQFMRLEAAGVTVSKARVLVALNSGKSIIGRDWLIALRYKISQPIKRGECNVNT